MNRDLEPRHLFPSSYSPSASFTSNDGRNNDHPPIKPSALPKPLSHSFCRPTSPADTNTKHPDTTSLHQSRKVVAQSHLLAARKTLINTIRSFPKHLSPNHQQANQQQQQHKRYTRYSPLLSRSSPATGTLYSSQPGGEARVVLSGEQIRTAAEEGSPRTRGRMVGRGRGQDIYIKTHMRRLYAKGLWDTYQRRKWRGGEGGEAELEWEKDEDEDEKVKACMDRVNARLGMVGDWRVGGNEKEEDWDDDDIDDDEMEIEAEEYEEDQYPTATSDPPSDPRSDPNKSGWEQDLPPLPKPHEILTLLPKNGDGISPQALARYFYPAIQNDVARRKEFVAMLREVLVLDTATGKLYRREDEKMGRETLGRGEERSADFEGWRLRLQEIARRALELMEKIEQETAGGKEWQQQAIGEAG